MKRVIGLTLLLLVLCRISAGAQDLVTITADDIELREPAFSTYVREKMPLLTRRLENLAKDRELLHLRVDFADFEQFWGSVARYYAFKQDLAVSVPTYKEEAIQIREAIFQKRDLKSPSAIKLILDYKFLKRDIDHATRSMEALDRDLPLLFRSLRHHPVRADTAEIMDLRTYAAAMVNALYDLSQKDIGYGDFEEVASVSLGPVENLTNAGHLAENFTIVAREIAGKGRLVKALKRFFGGIEDVARSVYNFELYVLENKKVTTARITGVLISVLILIAAYRAAKVVIYSRFGVADDKKYAVRMLVKYGVFVTIVPIVLAGVGLNLANITLLVSALSIGIGFGLTTLVSNFLSGILLLVEGYIEVGDRIRLENGEVAEVGLIGLRKCVLKTLDNVEIVIPNTDLISKNVVNLTLKDNSITRHRIPFSVNPAVDYKKLERVAARAAIRVLGGKEKVVQQDPTVVVTSLTTGEIGCALVVYMDDATRYIPDSAFLSELRKSFEANDIDIYLAPVTQVEMVAGDS